MSVGSNGERHYQLNLSADLQARLHRLHQRASDEGRGPQFIHALETIVKRLEKAPSSHGDPLYRLATLRLVVYEIAIYPIIVHYAVSDDLPIVYFKSVKLLSEKTL